VKTPDPRISGYLATLKQQGRSSPAGIPWHRFFEMLCAHKRADGSNPPVPLILAASGASNANKHERLGAQLDWARENDCLEQAMAALTAIPPEQWNAAPSERWDEDCYY
jgi:hypothetical protein